MPYDPELLRLAADIIAAHVSHNAMSVEALPDVFRSIYVALDTAGVEALPPDKPKPAVPVQRSVFPDYIVCLEDGKKMKLLKRHLKTAYDLTPEAYRKRWDLPAHYPMVAPSYAARRSAIANEIGLGWKPAISEEPPSPPIQQMPKGQRGRSVARKAQVT